MKPPPADDISDVSPSVETRDFHPSDRVLREHGFKIHARPKKGPAVWDLKGVLFTQPEAELRIKR